MLLYFFALPILLLNNPEVTNKQPRPEPWQKSLQINQDQAWAKRTNDAIWYSFGDEIFLASEREWVLSPLIKHQSGSYEPGTSSTCVGAVAVNFFTGETRQLLNPLVPDTFPSKKSWSCKIFPTSENRAGIVFYEDSSEVSWVRIWEWDLTKNRVRDAGEWPWGAKELFVCIDHSLCSVSFPEKKATDWNGTFRLTCGSKQMQYTLRPKDDFLGGKPAFCRTPRPQKNWFAPSGHAGSFIVCKEKPEIEIACEDVASEKGPKWRLTEKDLCKSLGVKKVLYLSTLRGQFYPRTKLFFAVEGETRNDDSVFGFFSVDTQNGKCEKLFFLDPEADESPNMVPSLSPDNRYCVYPTTRLVRSTDKKSQDTKTFIVILDFKENTTHAIEWSGTFGEVCEFLDERRFVISFLDCIWLWSKDKDNKWVCEKAFRLGKEIKVPAE